MSNIVGLDSFRLVLNLYKKSAPAIWQLANGIIHLTQPNCQNDQQTITHTPVHWYGRECSDDKSDNSSGHDNDAPYGSACPSTSVRATGYIYGCGCGHGRQDHEEDNVMCATSLVRGSKPDHWYGMYLCNNGSGSVHIRGDDT